MSRLDSVVADSIRLTLCYYAEQSSSHHAFNMRAAINNYFIHTGELAISEAGLLNLKSILAKDEYRVSSLRVFLKQSHALGTKLVDSTCLELLNSWTLKGNEKGLAVKSLCPESGPFSDIEYEAILHRLNLEYAQGNVSLRDYVLVSLFAYTGRRPIQIASLKVKDFTIDKKLLGLPIYVLYIPKAKVRKGKFRSSFSKFGLDNELAKIIALYIKSLISDVEKQVGRKLSETEKKELPLFPDDLSCFKELSNHELETLLVESDICHLKSSDLTSQLRAAICSLNIYSERTGKPLVITAYRFRYTLGTRAARDGKGLIEIATLLDHSDTQNVQCYTANVPEHAKTINHFMNNALLKYAAAFEGKVISNPDSESENVVFSDNGEEKLGNCGTSAFCYDFAPLSCYVCPKFKPWKNAPHQIVLDWLIQDRARILNSTGDNAMAAINDRVIVAVGQVIDICRTKVSEV